MAPTDASAPNQALETPLHKAAACRGGEVGAIISHLIAAGADVNAQDARGLTPLSMVLTSGE